MEASARVPIIVKPIKTQECEQKVWIRRSCQCCQENMAIMYRRMTKQEKTGLPLVETVYVCPYCDYWETLKIPQALALTIDQVLSDSTQPEHLEVYTALPENPQGPPLLWFICQFCPMRMHLMKYHIVKNERIGQTYIESEFVCPRCQCWQTTEIPLKLAESMCGQIPV